jgi:tRNA-Thr(GGU) m(6)t(6)A37 methyltransferase TsaA
MTQPPHTIVLQPIGVVRNSFTEKPDQPWESIESEILVDQRWEEALDGIEQFSHILVLFWLDRAEGDRGKELRIHPQRRGDLPEVGLFATRTMHRPNPIGVTAVPLLGRRGTMLRVRGLDALDGSPVLDLKPYLTRGDCWPEATVPWWIRKLWGTS